MPINTARIKRYLQEANFKYLFNELGWDNYSSQLYLTINSQPFTLQGVAEKRGVVALTCAVTGALPDDITLRKIERQVAQSHREHLIIYVNRDRSEQLWWWVRQEPGKPLASRKHRYHNGQAGDSLLQKLEKLAFGLAEEQTLTLIDVTGRLRTAFDVERVTKKFYENFTKERNAFQKFLSGVPDEEMARWYVSVMLNRLMFLYFIQQKGFLNGDQAYLRNKLGESTRQNPDRYYKDFLCPLFFEGLAKPEPRSTPIQTLLGRVPYLNGGIFEEHQIERDFKATIQLPDAAFQRIFAFFDQYQWHLDDRPLRDDREINPDVLGYIFEKYINQKEMGAYYTKEDITEYISKNTIIPFLFDTVSRQRGLNKNAFAALWTLLQQDPDRYIYPAVRKGCDLPLPPEIAAGITAVSRREGWNASTPEAYALPTEIWRETVARRQRYAEVHAKLAAGEVQAINDLITYNLDIRQFAQDSLQTCDDADLLNAFWTAIHSVTVLDPTCGSGAFLFAALNSLEPLYEACLARMESLLEELPANAAPQKYSQFRKVLDEVAKHPNQRYFIYKSIIVNNLYGVDIMPEAVEIARLRLFLKLAAQVEKNDRLPNFGIEPLPDIDFNIRAGNTLVGFATRAQMLDAVRGDKLLLLPEEEEALARIEEQAADVDRLFGKFKAMQTTHDLREFGDDYDVTKRELRRRLGLLGEELNRLLAVQYGKNPDKLTEYPQWLESHQPFHWFIEFYGIIQQGGFDVIIGNPPYLEYSQIKKKYSLVEEFVPYQTNLYSACCYRAIKIKKQVGYAAFIVPVSMPSTNRMQTLRKIISAGHTIYHIGFSTRPSKLFEGAEQRLTIYIQCPTKIEKVYSAGYIKWYQGERSHLFANFYFVDSTYVFERNNIWLKIRGSEQKIILEKMFKQPLLSQSPLILGHGQKLYYKNTGIRYFSTVTLRPPQCWINGVQASSSRETILEVTPE